MTHPASPEGEFDLEVVRKGFEQCQNGISDGKIPLDGYLEGYRELCKFFRLLGVTFGFVAKDIEEKMNALVYHKLSADGQHYQYIDTMIAYESDSDLINGSFRGHKSGSRSLLRLHRALEFILQFMSRVATSLPHHKMSTVAHEVYDVTLAKYHPWLVRKMASLAMYTLPTRDELVSALCKHDVTQLETLIGQVLNSAQPVYDSIQRQFESRDLLYIA